MSENKDYITFQDDRGSVNISDEVVTLIIAGAVLEVDGVAGLYTAPAEILPSLWAKRAPARGVKLRSRKTASRRMYPSWLSPAPPSARWARPFRTPGRFGGGVHRTESQRRERAYLRSDIQEEIG